jgi:hypothetical protein
MKRFLPACLFAMIGITLVSCSLDPPITGHRYALVYGVARYLTNFEPGVYPNLSLPGNDAESVSGMLAGVGYDEVRSRIVDDEGVFLLDGNAGAQADAPTKENLDADLLHFAGETGPDDLFVFYYSGHGSRDRGNTTTLHEWIDLYGTVVPSGTTFAYNWSAALYETELADMLSQLPTARKVVVLDSCYSGGFNEDGLEVDLTPPNIFADPTLFIISPEVILKAISNYAGFQTSSPGGISPYGNATVLAAAGSEEPSWEYSLFDHGVMTYYFLQAPQKADLNSDGAVTVLEAFSLVKAGIDVNWNTTVGPENTFEPHVSGGPVDFVLF